MWHPWRELRSLSEVVFAITPDLPSGNAWWSPKHQVVLMKPGLLQVERRCSLAHEMGHRALGHSGQECYPDQTRQAVRAELAADRWAARRLIELDDLVAAGKWTSCRFEAAEELWVTPHMLDVRLRTLHVSEQGLLEREGVGL